MNKILLKRKLKIVLPSIPPEKNSTKFSGKPLIASFLKNIESLGFTFSKDIIHCLPAYTGSELKKLQDDIVANLSEMVGSNVQYKPMYPNFPSQVAEASEAELYINAIFHYLDGIVLETPEPWLPEYKTEKRDALKDKIKLKVIKLGTEKEFFDIFMNLFNAKVSWSEGDKEDVKFFIEEYKGEAIDFLPESISNKENLAVLISIFKGSGYLSEKILSTYFKTATDVLRFISALSAGDVSLAKNTKFKSPSKADRRLILRILDIIGRKDFEMLLEDLVRHKEKWLRVMEGVHPGEYEVSFPLSFKAFKILRNEHIETFNSKVERYFHTEQFEYLTNLLITRPGEFARKLDWFLRSCGTKRAIITKFSEVVDKVSVNVLLQMRTHFTTRNEEKYRAFYPKGSVANVHLIDNELPKIGQKICDDIVELCDNALIKKFSSKEKLGKVYIEEALKDCTVPLVLRNTSKALKTISRGSKIQMEKGKGTIRLFLHWKNIDSKLPSDDTGALSRNSIYNDEGGESGERVDIDLSTVLYDKDFNWIEHISYTNLKSESIKAYHSGDIVSAPRGASEFIDIDIQSALKQNARYIIANVNIFTGQKYKDIPECFAGCMFREKPQSGEIYDPKTVEYKFDLTAESGVAVPLIFDMVENQIIWCDMNIDVPNIGWGARANNVENNAKGIVAIGRALTELSKPNLYDLFRLHAKARGRIVKNKVEADVVFGLTKGDVTAYDIDKIVSEYL